MLADSELPLKFWAMAAETATYLHNKMPQGHRKTIPVVMPSVVMPPEPQRRLATPQGEEHRQPEQQEKEPEQQGEQQPKQSRSKTRAV